MVPVSHSRIMTNSGTPSNQSIKPRSIVLLLFHDVVPTTAPLIFAPHHPKSSIGRTKLGIPISGGLTQQYLCHPKHAERACEVRSLAAWPTMRSLHGSGDTLRAVTLGLDDAGEERGKCASESLKLRDSALIPQEAWQAGYRSHG